MWRPALVVAVVVLAGCSGLFVGETPSDEAAPVTPVPVPTDSADATVQVPRSNDTVDIERLLERHETALETRSFHRRVVREGPQNTRDVWVDRDADIRRVRQRFGPLTDDVVVVDDTAYRNVPDDPSRAYTSVDYDTDTPYVASLSGRALLEGLLTANRYERVGTDVRAGRPVAVVAVDRTAGTAADTNDATVVRSRLYVDRHGIVRHVDHRERRPDRSNLTVEMTVTTGLDRVPVPWWLEERDPYTSGSM